MKECNPCEKPKIALLSNGQMVCTYCPNWLVECEARHLLAMPLNKRREGLEAREKKRGSTGELKEAMTRIHSGKQTKPKLLKR